MNRNKLPSKWRKMDQTSKK